MKRGFSAISALSVSAALAACASQPPGARLDDGGETDVTFAIVEDENVRAGREGSAQGSSDVLDGVFFINGASVGLTVQSAQLGAQVFANARNCQLQYAASALVREAVGKSFKSYVVASTPVDLPPTADRALDAYFERGPTAALRVALQGVSVHIVEGEGGIEAEARTTIAQSFGGFSGGPSPAERGGSYQTTYEAVGSAREVAAAADVCGAIRKATANAIVNAVAAGLADQGGFSAGPAG